MATKSINVLKGETAAKKAAVAATTTETPAAEVAAETVTETAAEQTAAPEGDAEAENIDVDKLDKKGLDEVVAKYVDPSLLPADWKKLKLGEKRAWLKTQFEEVPEAGTDAASAEAATEAPAETKAEEPAPATEAPKPAKAEKAAKPAKSTAVTTKSAPIEGEIVQPGSLAEIIQEVESLGEKDAKATAVTLREAADATVFRLGGVLARIQENKWFAPYGSFREYIEKEIGFKYRKGMYLVQIYVDLSNANIPWAKVAGLGWSKLKEISGVINDKNVDEWVGIAKEQSQPQLIDTVANAKKAAAGGGEVNANATSSPAMKSMGFRFHPDQHANVRAALDKIKKVMGTEFDSVALDSIATQTLGGAIKAVAVDVQIKAMSAEDQMATLTKAGVDFKALLKLMGDEAAFNAIGEAFPEYDITVSPKEEAA